MEADRYEALDVIGRGSFGIIRKVRRKSDGHILCRKEISYLRMSQKEREQLQAELAILKGLRHRNIVAYYEREHLKSSSDLHIYMEFCEDGDLARKIRQMKSNNQMAEEDFVWSVFAQLVCGLYRCHKGQDPPEVGKNVIGLGSDVKPSRMKPEAVVLHRDLKPDNIFLGSDASVKIGDFGLSKIIASHDFASTYVGTPFYMSPEICAAESYGWASDIWALGCVVYELCAKEPPFNARTHLELIQKIRLGRVKPLPAVYSKDLQDVVMQCIRVNQTTRPDTATLLNLPMVKLKRKEIEMVDLGRKMQTKIDLANQQLKDQEQTLIRERERVRLEMDRSLRREWEVKARLEIDRQVEQAMARLQRDFDHNLEKRLVEELHRRAPLQATYPTPESRERSTTPDLFEDEPDVLLDEMSLNSPCFVKRSALKKTSRTPFTRAQTMVDSYSPMDIRMGNQTPAPAPSIANLGLSPRQARTQQNTNRPRSRNNIFDMANDSRVPTPPAEDDFPALPEDSDDEDVPDLPIPSPTRSKNPFKALRPGIKRQATAPSAHKNVRAQSTLFTRPPSPMKLKENQDPKAPERRYSKLPSRAATIASIVPSGMALTSIAPASPTKDLRGRSLVELSAATIWDPERDEMPSPFLHRAGRQPLGGHRGGPGLSHLR